MGSTTRFTRALAAAALAVAATVVATTSTAGRGPARAAAAEVAVPGTGAAHPRVLYAPGTESVLRDRIDREPLATVFRAMHARADGWDDRTLGDPSLNVQRDLTRAAKVRAFEYALDRTVVSGDVVAFGSTAERDEVGDFARDVLLQVYDRSRLAVPPPIGGWDRDISTSEEIVNAAEAFDLLLGAGYPFTDEERAEIVGRLQRVTEELHANFVDPDTANGFARLHQNNHRTKSGASMALAAIVLADDVPTEQARRWFDTGTALVDDSLRYVLVTGDGAYAEGTHYYTFTYQNLLPLLRAWELQLGASSWTTTDDIVVPALARHPLFARSQRWMIDVTLPDGSMASFDDANVRRSGEFGALPPTLPDDALAAARWRWANAPQPFDTDGNVELGPEAIAAYDDVVAPAPPSWSPTQFYVEGGTASLRSSWDRDAVMALVLGEHDTASQFGRDRTGTGRHPQSHEHPDPGSFLMQAFGEDLALDPGYLTFTTHGAVNQAEHHNVVLVDGKGPGDYLIASVGWAADPLARPPAEGQSTIAATLDTDATDVATVVSDYQGAAVERRFLFGGGRYLVVSDRVDAYAAADATLTWPVNGNGGENSGGTFASTASGGEWTFGGARLTTGIAVPGLSPTFSTRSGVHEAPGNQQRTHTVLDASAPADVGGAVQVLYPTRSGDPAPTITASSDEASPWVRVDAPADDRRLTATRPAEADSSAPEVSIPALSIPEVSIPALSPSATADGVTGGAGALVVDRTTDGALRSAWADDATSLAVDGGPSVSVASPGSLGISFDDPTKPTSAEVVATGDADRVVVEGLGFVPSTADGACGLDVDPATGAVTLLLNRERRVVLHTGSADARPAADAGPGGRVTPGTAVVLDGTGSCDADGGALSHDWELVSAPAGSAWQLDGAATATPTLLADRVGPYRVRLVVTDAAGNRSLEQEVMVIAGSRCADGVDDDLDGRIDTDDPDCDGPDDPPHTTTTTTTSTTATSTTIAPTTTVASSTTTVPSSSSSTVPTTPTTSPTTGTTGTGPISTTAPGPSTTTSDVEGPTVGAGAVVAGGSPPRPAAGASPVRGQPNYTG